MAAVAVCLAVVADGLIFTNNQSPYAYKHYDYN